MATLEISSTGSDGSRMHLVCEMKFSPTLDKAMQLISSFETLSFPCTMELRISAGDSSSPSTTLYSLQYPGELYQVPWNILEKLWKPLSGK